MNRLQELAQRIESRDLHMGVIGLGYVGLPLAVEFARAGVCVTGFDVDEKKIQSLRDGVSYIEDVPSADVAKAIESGQLSVTSDFAALSNCDVINVCVPTPLTKTKSTMPTMPVTATGTASVAQRTTARAITAKAR